MPILTVDHQVEGLCGGEQWFVDDLDGLASLVAIVMVGRANLVASILAGAEAGPAPTSEALRSRLRSTLSSAANASNRDALLFETISWLVARKGSAGNEIISDPHRRATNQGADSVKVAFDEAARELQKVTVYEQKCTANPRKKFRDEVLPAFKDWITGTRDDELLQIAIGLLARFNLTDVESNQAYGRIALAPRPVAFRAALTVSPEAFPKGECKKVFKDYDDLAVEFEARFGDTFPLKDMRGWFNDFAALVWTKIEALNV